MLEKIREFAGEGTTHLAAGVFATVANENAFFKAVLVALITILTINWRYNLIQKLRGCKTPHLCAEKIILAEERVRK